MNLTDTHRSIPDGKSRYLILGLSSVNFFTLGVIVAAIGPALDELTLQTGSSLTAIGGIFMAISLGALVAQLVGGQLVDRAGPRRLLPAAMLLMSVGAFGITQARALWVCLLCAGVSGLGQGMVHIASHVMISGLFADKRAAALNFMNVFFGVGAFAGPALAGLTLREFHTALPSILAGAGFVLLFIPLALAWLPREAGKHIPTEEMRGEMLTQGNPYTSLRLWLFGTILLLYVGIEIGMGGWSSTYLQRTVQVPPETGAAVTSGFWLALTVGRVVATFLGTRISARVLLGSSLLTTIAGCLLLGLGYGGLEGSVAGILLLGFGYGPIFPTTIALVTTTFQHAAGRATGVVVAMGSTGGMLLPWLLGALIEGVGAGVTPWLALAVGVGMLACAVGVTQLGKRKRGAEYN
ncbi:MAG TPA: MFS transporter [Anaerolineaceae bacterium]|nr:MFS transporter [Anaerolineaceae bacterium]